ncbi:MAG TPA: FtsX-like permease family protein [Chryseolinea sp.]|nr:FtsX-like permease family protein [Chryseolinea sp.]
MIRSYILIAFRNMQRNRLHAFVNILGLSIGIACCILITLFVQFELSYDKHNKRADRIYRMAVNVEPHSWAVSFCPIGALLKDNFAEVETYARIKPEDLYIRNSDRNVKHKEKVFYADSSVFDVLDIRLLKGDPTTALSEINSMVITPERARVYFGDEDPLGKTLTFMNDKTEFKITGVFEPLPSNSHVHMNIMVSSDNFEMMKLNSANGWNYYINHYTYLVLPVDIDHVAFAKKISSFMGQYPKLRPDQRKNDIVLQPLTSIHLHSNLGMEIEANGSMNTVYIMIAISFFILIIACINFTNLTTAQSLKRAREIGIRKVVGCKRTQLVFQFLSESVLVSLAALTLAILILIFIVPTFNEISNKEITLNPLRNSYVIILFLGLTFFVGVLAGTYPAFFISNFNPTMVLKGKFISNVKGRIVRQGLVVFQFAVAFAIIVGTFIIYSQLDYMLNKDIGFDREQTLIVKMPKDSVGDQSIKNEMLRLPGVVSATRFVEIPGNIVRTMNCWYEGAEDKRAILYLFSGDVDLLKTLGMKMKVGDYFNEGTKRFSKEFILNETAVKKFGWKPQEAVGKLFNFGKRSEDPGMIIGVVEDFHFKHLHDKIDPLVMVLWPDYEGCYLALKVGSNNLSQTVNAVEGKWKKLLPQYEFEYQFLDESFDKLFNQERQLGQVFGIFSGLAIFISCMGLFGLASFTMEQSRKAVAIRKVLGASVSSIFIMMSGDFLKLVVIGIAISAPIAWLIMDKWLQGFAYNVEVEWIVFLYTAFLATVVALLTISYHAMRVAATNPVSSLKEQ